MSKLHRNVVLFVILMVTMLPAYGMFRVRQWRVSKRTAAAGRDVQEGATVRPTVSRHSVATTSTAGQRRVYQSSAAGKAIDPWYYQFLYGPAVPSDGPVAQSTGNGWFRGLFSRTLTPEEFVKELEECIFRKGEWTAPGGRSFDQIPLFDGNDLAKAKRLIDENKEMINQDIQDRGGTKHIKYSDEYYTFNHLTVLDRVLNAIFRPSQMIDTFHASDRELKLIELLKYLISVGAVISQKTNLITK